MKKIVFVLLGCVFGLPIFGFAQTDGVNNVKSSDAQVSRFHWDTNLGISSRSYPVGGTLNAGGGVSLLLWGEENAPQLKSPFFSYIRFGVQGSTLGSFNSAAGELALYPIAPLELAVGKYFQTMGSDFEGFDCARSQCKGELQNSFLRASLLVGYGDWFGLTRGIWREWERSSTKKNFVEIESAMLGNGGEETQFSSTLLLGKKLSSKMSIGMLYAQSRMQVSEQSQNQWSGFGVYDLGAWKYSFGAGTFASSEKDQNPFLFGKITYDFKSPIGFY